MIGETSSLVLISNSLVSSHYDEKTKSAFFEGFLGANFVLPSYSLHYSLLKFPIAVAIVSSAALPGQYLTDQNLWVNVTVLKFVGGILFYLCIKVDLVLICNMNALMNLDIQVLFYLVEKDPVAL